MADYTCDVLPASSWFPSDTSDIMTGPLFATPTTSSRIETSKIFSITTQPTLKYARHMTAIERSTWIYVLVSGRYAAIVELPRAIDNNDDIRRWSKAAAQPNSIRSFVDSVFTVKSKIVLDSTLI